MELFGVVLYDAHIKPIYLLQKKVIRAISFKSSSCPSTPIFCAQNILKLYDLIELKLLSFVYEPVNKIPPIFFHNFLKP